MACSGNLSGIRLFVNAAFAARLPFKVFDGIRNVNFFSINPRFHQSFIQHSSGRTNKRLPFQILSIARLFPYENNFGFRSALAKYGLRCALP